MSTQIFTADGPALCCWCDAAATRYGHDNSPCCAAHRRDWFASDAYVEEVTTELARTLDYLETPAGSYMAWSDGARRICLTLPNGTPVTLTVTEGSFAPRD